MLLHDAQLDDLRSHGFLLVRNFLAPGELARAQENLRLYFPTAEELQQTPERYPHIQQDPEHLQVEFPFADSALNQLTVHPQLLELTERLLGEPGVMLSRSVVWAKYAGLGDFEQVMHSDFEGNTLVVPRDDGVFLQLLYIVYLSDVTEELGPTCVVDRQYTREQSIWPPFRSREEYARMYDVEQPVLARAGDLLIYTMSTFHRGSALTASHGARFTHHIEYRSTKNLYSGYQNFASYGEQPALHQLLEQSTPRQRQALGFPAPGHAYWTPQTIAQVQERYPGMDLSPYRAMMQSV